MPAPRAAYSASAVTSTLEYFWTIRWFEMILDATTTLTNNSEAQFLRTTKRTACLLFHKHIPETKLSTTISQTEIRLLPQSNPETQLFAITSRTTLPFATEVFCSKMTAGFQSAKRGTTRHRTTCKIFQQDGPPNDPPRGSFKGGQA